MQAANITWWYFFFQVLELLTYESKSRCSDHCPCVTNNLKCTGMCSCRDWNNTVEIDSDMESDDESDKSYEHGDNHAYDDEEDI